MISASHMGTDKHRRLETFFEWEVPLTRKSEPLKKIFGINLLENRRIYFRQIFGVCKGWDFPHGFFCKIGVGPQI